MKTKERNNPWSDGFIVVVTYVLCVIWVRYVAIWGWAPFFHRPEGASARQRINLMDGIWIAMLALSIIAYTSCYSAYPAHASPTYRILVAVAAFRVVDHFFSHFTMTVFGNRYGRAWWGAMSPRRLRRTLILNIIYFIELVFWYAVLYYHFSLFKKWEFTIPIQKPENALQTAMSTITTIGYGTYAPSDPRAVVLASFEALTGLILIGGLLAGTVSAMASNKGDDEPPKNVHDTRNKMDSGLLWGIRWVLPPLLTSLCIIVAYRIIHD